MMQLMIGLPRFRIGDMARILYIKPFTTYLLFFYTNVYGLNVATPCFR